MNDEQIAVVSDIHGNSWALREVLEDIHRRGIDDIVNLGDSIYGPLDPAGTADMLLWLDQPAVSGNEDRLIIEPSRIDKSPTLRYVLENLAPDHIAWLKGLAPTGVAYENFFLCHGTPERDDEYLLVKVAEAGVSLRGPRELAEALSGVKQPIILCGHDHVPRVANLPDGRLIVNPGSVGLPAYADYLPHLHMMEAGSPHARYSVISKGKSGWRIENVAIPYDWEAAARAAAEHERPDWAEWLSTGRAGPS